MTLEERAADRKAYVERARNSFLQGEERNNKSRRDYGVNTGYLKEEEAGKIQASGRYAGIRLLFAVMLFAAYLISAVTGMKIYTFSAEDIEEQVEKDFGDDTELDWLKEKLQDF